MTNRREQVIHIRTWNYHAGLKKLGSVSGYVFETRAIPADLAVRMPRVAMIAGSCSYPRRALTDGLYGHPPKRDVDRRPTRNLELRPLLRLIVADPVQDNCVRQTLAHDA